MGLTISWIAVKGGKKGDIFERLGLEEIGETIAEIGLDFASPRRRAVGLSWR